MKKTEVVKQAFENTLIEEGNSIQKLSEIFNFYMLINGIIPIKEIEKIIENEGIDKKIYKENKEKILKENEIEVYKNDYYVLTSLIETECPLDDLLKLKKELSYKILPNKEIILYLSKLAKFTNELAKTLKTNEDVSGSILFRIMLCPYETSELLDKIKTNFKINKKTEEKVGTLLEDMQESIRYWSFNGRTYVEYDDEEIINDMLLTEKPKINTLVSCIESLGDDGIENVIANYLFNATTPKKLAKIIIDDFKETVSEVYDQDYFTKILNCHQKEFNYDLNKEDFLGGYVYIYKEDGKLKTFLPKEIADILKNTDINKLPKEDNEKQANLTIEDLEQAFKECLQFAPDENGFTEEAEVIDGYIQMNGIIEKNKLQQLLKENHNIDLNIKELDKLIKDNNFGYSIANVYSCISDMSEDDIKEILKEKNKIGNYRIWDNALSFNNIMFEVELDDYLSEELELKKEIEENLFSMLITFVRENIFSLDMFNYALEYLKINLKESQKRKIIDLIKKYKNEVSVWKYNGYTANEINEMNKINKKAKVGRNEPCPCGSGKKYKQCCGK